MAQIVLENQELINILRRYLPPVKYLTTIEAAGRDIRFTFKASPFLPSTHLVLKFAGYHAPDLHYQLESGPMLRLLIDAFKNRMPAGIQLTDRLLKIDIQRFIAQKTNDWQITEVLQADDGRYLIEIAIV